ncbi:class-E vacuolar protein-sorting protein 24 (Vps24p) [Reticulomyxa filosa]|uniref:Class-E vacuolar protein-sorting protein 24 (Vps24p) n=1 Tax=Reticulomyxa filosa TaxID=46433 RepID=X6N9D9_RETFI|nr:class-E vacuolar protein-sorting protein 24 (Vps24p) [Reticulomyxa filosa]|eukprot:ETO21902.1 class-E vacuolar protein-sorting protein 24 (Vps24p) [Reticulomyxa filosa]
MSKRWIKELKHQQRELQQQIRKAERVILKLKLEMKKEAKKAKKEPALVIAIKILAKGLVRCNKNLERLYTLKTQINSIILGIKEQQANIKISKMLEASAVVSAKMNELIKISEAKQWTTDMAMEMQKMGLIQEVCQDLTNKTKYYKYLLPMSNNE